MKLNEIIGAKPILEKIAAKEMEAAAALEFAKFVKVIAIAIQDFEVKRTELFQKYGKATGEGEERRIQVLPENEKKFNAAIKRALNKDVDVNPFDMSVLGVVISPVELVNATDLFV